MEEFHVSNPFVDWFCEQLGVFDVSFDGAWHSVTDADGETDLLLRVEASDLRVGVLIENKIAAPEQMHQDERYHIRAVRAQNAGYFERFVVCMCAPRMYLDSLSENSSYQALVAYEDLSEWFGRFDDARSRWRRAIIDEAIAQSRRGYRMVVNETVSRFHQEFWEYVSINHPQIEMRRPTPKGNKSNWILFKGTGFPKGVGFHVKIDQRMVELGFAGHSVAEIIAAFPELPSDIRKVQKGKTAALAVSVPALDLAKPLAMQTNELATTMAAVERLMHFGRVWSGVKC